MKESPMFKAFRLTVVFIIAGILMACLAAAILKVPTSAQWDDPTLEQMELAYDEALNTEANALETQQRALETYYNASSSRCDLEKALAHYKLAMGYEMNREAELKAKTEMNCIAF